LLANLKQILADDFLFILLSSHSNGYTPLALQNLLLGIVNNQEGTFEVGEMIVREQDSGRVLPSGASALYVRR